MMNQSPKIIISGGGTGGHVFPAISVAQAIKALMPEAELLFVGALGKIEMEKVPAAGFKIIGLPVQGIKRKLSPANIAIVFKLLVSLFKARKIIKEFKPDVVVGVGGYASGPVLQIAGCRGIPTVIQEQNSYAGVTNRILAKKAKKICVAYDGMEKYFPAGKIILTGNPVRKDIIGIKDKQTDACDFFQLDQSKKTVLVLGGSLGARTINNSMLAKIGMLIDNNYQVLWQTGKLYYDAVNEKAGKMEKQGVFIHAFINRMDYAYSVADIIISRAGAGTISELCLVGKPVILVPSPNVAEDHQTGNALSLAVKSAAVMIRDAEAAELLVPSCISLLNNRPEMEKLSGNIKKLAIPDSANRIAFEILKFTE